MPIHLLFNTAKNNIQHLSWCNNKGSAREMFDIPRYKNGYYFLASAISAFISSSVISEIPFFSAIMLAAFIALCSPLNHPASWKTEYHFPGSASIYIYAYMSANQCQASHKY